MKRLTSFPLFILMLLLASCTQASVAAQPPVNISIAGSTAFFPVLFELTEAFSARYPNVVFDVRGGGSSFGEEQLRQGQISLAASTYLAANGSSSSGDETGDNANDDTGYNAGGNTEGNTSAAGGSAVVAEPVEDGQGEDGQGEGGGPQDEDTESIAPTSAVPIPIGLDGLSIIVHSKNRINNLSLMELQDIYSGRILDWEDLGGVQGEILLVIREDGSGVLELFEARVMADAQVSLTAVIMPTNADVLQYVALHPTAIGFISRGYLMNNSAARAAVGSAIGTTVGAIRNNGESEPPSNESGGSEQTGLDSAPPERPPTIGDGIPGNISRPMSNAYLESLSSVRGRVAAVAVNGQLPTQAAILNQQYYLVHPLYLVAADEPSGWLALFVDFVLSPSGQEIVSRYHAPIR